MRLIGLTFFTLATYLAAESTHDLLTRARPGETAAGLAITAAALIVMPALALAKRRTGLALGNRTLVTESAETFFKINICCDLVGATGFEPVTPRL